MDNQEQNDPVWDLLEHASTTRPSPLFSRNVMRGVRLSKERQGGFTAVCDWLFRSRTLAYGGLAAAVLTIACLVLFRGQDNPITPVDPLVYEEEAGSFDPAAEFEQMEYLGQLMAVADPGDLSDDILADLFY